ncbi:MAG: prepilin-type N-terminal cleavage/methylation domain-containing protein [Verrucomicrobiota bacterium]
MVCNPTSTKRRRTAAMTLVEVMVASGIAGIVFAAVASLSFYTARSFAALSNYVDLDQQSRNALDQMSMKIRQADGLLSYETNSITLSYQGGSLIYTYNSGTRQVTETVGGRTEVLLEECDYLNFQIFQRNTAAGTFDQFPVTSDTATAKLVQVSWTCSRTILGQKVNTESIMAAKIVIRKQ